MVLYKHKDPLQDTGLEPREHEARARELAYTEAASLLDE